jgi:translation initiation factor IF-3
VKDRLRVNNQIRVPYVRLVGPDGRQIGIVPVKEALLIAQRQGLDLVEVAAQADPPVCKILDYGRYLYQQRVKERESRRGQHAVTVRQVRFSMKIDEHDYQTKLRKIREFLKRRDRVKVLMILRGREVVHKHRALELIERLEKDLAEEAYLEPPPYFEGEGRVSVHTVLVPK